MKKYNLINNTLGWLCFFIAAATYLLTIEPTASFWDCPEFISQGAKLEVGHPPGNPIFMLTARFFVTLFGGSDISHAAVAVNSMSALLSAGTILLLFWTITHLIRKIIVRDDANEISWTQMLLIMGGGLSGALAYTWSDTFWFSAVEGEVYAFSSFCTALVFWLILKWENRADDPHSDRYLVLIAFVIGVSIAVHLLNLLCIPAIGLVFYFRKFKNINTKGSLVALVVACAIVGLILYGLVPGYMTVAQSFELFFVNTVGLGYNMGVLIYAIVLVASYIWAVHALYQQKSATQIKLSFFVSMFLSGILFIGHSTFIAVILTIALLVYLFMFCKRVPVRIFNVIVLSVFVIFIGYSSYALLLIRASANTPMNQNAPDNVFALASYMSREQYGDRPLFYGPTWAEELEEFEYPENSGNYYVAMDENGYPSTKPLSPYLRTADGSPIDNGTTEYTKVVKSSPDEPDQYVQAVRKPDYKTMPDLNMPFTRIYSSDASHISGYKGWGEYYNPDFSSIPADSLASWRQYQYLPLAVVAPYLNNLQTVTTYVDDSGNTVASKMVYKPSFWDNVKYFVNYQLNHMYWRYFMWNFVGRQNDIQGNGEPHLGNWISGIPVIDNARLGDQSLLPDEYGKDNKGHNVFYMLPFLLGVIGLLWQSLAKHWHPTRGIEHFWVVFFLFFMTGIAIVLYLNQTPGQPRERDYAFAGSFYAFAIWIGIGVPALAVMLRKLIGLVIKPKDVKNPTPEQVEEATPAWAKTVPAVVAAVIGILVPLQMVSQTWDDHDRSDRYTTRDFGANYLNSLDKNAIIFTNGDNDTFPLWYAQEVEGERTDVRVVNLSYLTTEWYANQMLHPTYDAKAVDMYARPTDYGYDNFSWSFVVPRTDESTEAEKALKEFYASDKDVDNDAHFFTTPKVYIPVNKSIAAKRYGLNMNSQPSDSSVVTLADVLQPEDIKIDFSQQGQGLSLSKILAFDMITNSVKGGWKRPVYFASTVPTSYYLGLSPYLSSTGMASEVTPFKDSAISPNTFKAYENIVSKFRWGGLDKIKSAKDIYLDETVRRMVSSTRLAMYDVAENLVAMGDAPASQFAVDYAKKNGQPAPATCYDMARVILNLMVDKLPDYAAPYEGMMGIYMAQLYKVIAESTGNPDDIDHAVDLLKKDRHRYAQLVRYATSLSPYQLSHLGTSDSYALLYLSYVIGIQNNLDLSAALAKMKDSANPDYVQFVHGQIPADVATQLYQWVYVDCLTQDDLRKSYNQLSGRGREIAEYAMLLLQIHHETGVKTDALTEEIAKEYGIDMLAWRRLLKMRG